jgi:hypothetical protein
VKIILFCHGFGWNFFSFFNICSWYIRAQMKTFLFVSLLSYRHFYSFFLLFWVKSGKESSGYSTTKSLPFLFLLFIFIHYILVQDLRRRPSLSFLSFFGYFPDFHLRYNNACLSVKILITALPSHFLLTLSF